MAGAYQGRSGKPTVILEAVADSNLRVWHHYFGCPGSQNDLNVLGSSPLFYGAIYREEPTKKFTVNGNEYSRYYYLVDGIYPSWSVFIPGLSAPISEKAKYFTERQSAKRKDIERLFGVLKCRWKIFSNPFRQFSLQRAGQIIKTILILHNFLLISEGRSIENTNDFQREVLDSDEDKEEERKEERKEGRVVL